MTKTHGYFTQRCRFDISKPCACLCLLHCQAALVVTNPPAKAEDGRDAGLIPGSRKSPGEAHGNPLQYSCLENPDGQRSLVGCSPRGCKESDDQVTKTSTVHTVSHSACTNLHFHQQYMWIPFSPHPSLLLFVFFLMIAILTSVR